MDYHQSTQVQSQEIVVQEVVQDQIQEQFQNKVQEHVQEQVHLEVQEKDLQQKNKKYQTNYQKLVKSIQDEKIVVALKYQQE